MPNEVEQRLRAIAERVNRATPGPWLVQGVGAPTMSGAHRQHTVMLTPLQRLMYPAMELGDAELIAHAREDIPWLLALLREREETIAKLREMLGEARWLIDSYGPVHHPGTYDKLIDEMDAAVRGAQ